MHCRTPIGLMLLMSACAVSNNPSVRRDLEKESTSRGLALVRARGSSMVVVPFDGPESFFAIERGTELSGSSKSGELLFWSSDPIRGRGDFRIITVGGKTIRREPDAAGSFVFVALNEVSGRFTFLSRTTDGKPGLFWTSFDLSRRGFIDHSTGDNSQGDWSPDGRYVVYETNNTICVFDTVTSSKRELAVGHDPVWSPSGNLISFRSDNGQASVMTAEGQHRDWALSKYRPLSAIRWSPDGKYVAFSVDRPLHIPLIGAYFDLLVCRVSDGQATSVKSLGLDSPDLQGFFWILDYRHFCADCKRGEPFN